MSPRIALLSFLAAVLAAQERPSLIDGDPFDCFRMSGAPAATQLIVDIEGMPFARAWRIRTEREAANPWDIRTRCFATRPASRGDVVVATFWMRTVSAGSGYTTFVVEKGREPYTKSVEWTVSAGSSWKRIQIPFTIAETYTGTGAEPYNLSFWVTHQLQEIEIGGLTVENYGHGVAFGDLGLAGWPYEGHEPDAPWRAEAARRIDEYRKSDLTVAVRDSDGRALAGVPVRVRMKRHAFGFGTAVAGQALMDMSENGRRYRETLQQNFNKTVLENDLKWPFWETWARGSAAFALDWLPANGLPDVRGHNIIWPGRANLPADVVRLLSDPERLRTRIYDHIREVVEYARGKVTEWDVINEPYSNKDVQAVLGEEEMAVWFRKAREIDPDAKLYVNDYNIVEAGGFDLRHQNGYYRIIRLLLDNGAALDGIGIQGHFNTNVTPPERVWEIYDRFAEFGKDLQITEFDINTADEALQARYTRDFLTASFAHPAITGFMIWGFWEGRHWKPAAAMFRRDWSIKPNGEAWR
ncbi:MAG TPA: endo-1,4-beta-xylanase, partial [Bryobacteraceae bacterium]|nr:endo-1,4-beta-xylanase [Bryobacteraceae bacterium]